MFNRCGVVDSWEIAIVELIFIRHRSHTELVADQNMFPIQEMILFLFDSWRCIMEGLSYGDGNVNENVISNIV